MVSLSLVFRTLLKQPLAGVVGDGAFDEAGEEGKREATSIQAKSPTSKSRDAGESPASSR